MLHQLVNYVEYYLNERCTLRDLEAWLLSNLQGILDSGNTISIEQANHIDADLVELGEGLIDEATLRERLETYLRISATIPFAFSEVEHPATVHATAAVQTINHRSEIPVPGAVEVLRWDHVFALPEACR